MKTVNNKLHAGNHGDRAVMDSLLGTIARPCPASGSVGSPWCGLQRPTKSLTYAVGTPGQVPIPRSSERRLRAQRGSAGTHHAGSLRRQRTARLFWECLARTSCVPGQPWPQIWSGKRAIGHRVSRPFSSPADCHHVGVHSDLGRSTSSVLRRVTNPSGEQHQA